MTERVAARAARLPPDVLVALVASCAESSPLVRAALDVATAQHDPVPAWAVASVLTSPDLLPPLMTNFEMWHCAVAHVCAAWHAAWLATADERQWQVAVDLTKSGLVKIQANIVRVDDTVMLLFFIRRAQK